jgi:hypothetical protein
MELRLIFGSASGGLKRSCGEVSASRALVFS